MSRSFDLESFARANHATDEQVRALDAILTHDKELARELLPEGSIWREGTNLLLLRSCITQRDEQESPRRPAYVIAARLCDALDATIPLNQERDRLDILLARAAVAMLSCGEFPTTQSVIEWVTAVLEREQESGIEKELASVIAASDDDALSPHQPALTDLVEARFIREQSVWQGAMVRLVWARREENPQRVLDTLQKLDSLGQIGVETIFGEAHKGALAIPIRNALLAESLRLAGFMQSRLLLKAIDGEQDAILLPGLVRLGKIAPSAATQRGVLDACIRIGSPTAEPLIIAMLEHPSNGMKHAACETASRLGTRLSMEKLLALKNHSRDDSLREAAEEAIAQIEARYPASDLAQLGSLTLSEGDTTRGALSLALKDEGALSLYREVEEAARGEEVTALETSSGGAIAPAWYRLEVAPRSIPRASWLELSWRRNRSTWLAFVLASLAAIFVWVPTEGIVLPHAILAIAIWPFFFARSVKHMRARARALRDGLPSLGDHLSCDYEQIGDNKVLVENFGYLTEEGDYVEQRRRFEGALHPQGIESELEHAPPRPILYLPSASEQEREAGTDVVFIEDFRAIGISQDGNLKTRPGYAILYGLLAMAHLIALIAIVARLIFFFF